jgi:hypothetical protein
MTTMMGVGVSCLDGIYMHMPAFVGISLKAVTYFNEDPVVLATPTRTTDVARVERKRYKQMNLGIKVI